jgi:WD40 repeat protein
VKISAFNDSWNACIRTIQVHDSAERSIAFSHKHNFIAVGESHGHVEISETARGQRRSTLTTNNTVRALTFSPDDTILVSACDEGHVDVWDLQTGGLASAIRSLSRHVGQ